MHSVYNKRWASGGQRPANFTEPAGWPWTRGGLSPEEHKGTNWGAVQSRWWQWAIPEGMSIAGNMSKYFGKHKSAHVSDMVSNTNGSDHFLKFFYIGIKLKNNVVLAAGVEQNDSVTHISILFQTLFHLGYYRILSWALCATPFSWVIQLCPTLCDPMNCSTPGLPVHHQLPEFTQTHVHRAGDAIQPSHPLSSPSPPAPNPSQHQGLFQWVNSLHGVAKGLEFQLQHQPFQWTPRTNLL